MAPNDEKGPSSPADFKAAAARTWMIDLPSGLRVRVRRPRVLRMVQEGHLPSELFGAAMGVKPEGKAETDPLKNHEEKLKIFHAYICASAVEPRFVKDDARDQDAVSVHDLSDEDTLALFNGIARLAGAGEGGEAKDLAPFRPEPASGDAGPTGEEVQPATV